MKHRLQAAYDIVRGRVPKGMAVTSPFFYGAFNYGQAKGNVTPPRNRLSIERLRRFSETSIPRRFIDYYRNQIGMLDWWIVPKAGVIERFNQQQAKRVRQVTNLLERPNADMNWNTFIKQAIEEMCVPGVAPIEVKTLRRREISDINDDTSDAARHMLYVFDGSSLSYYTDWDGSPSSPRYAQILPDGNVVNFANSEVIPMRYDSRASTPHGLSPMEVAYQDIERFLETGAYSGRTASNVSPKKALFIKGLQKEQRDELLAYWRSDVEGSGSIPILGGEDAQTLELGLVTDANLFLGFQEFLITVIASAFGIDAMKANVIAGVNRSTGDTMSQTTDEGAIKPFADDIAQYINERILPLYDLADVAEFRFIYTSISDQKAISTVNQVELQDDSITVDEARFRQGKPPLLHPLTKEPIGHVTLSYYRELLKVPEFRLRGFAGLEEALERQRTMEEAKQSTGGDNFGGGENSNNTNPDKSQRGGNGVNSAPKPKEKAFNQRNDDALDTA